MNNKRSTLVNFLKNGQKIENLQSVSWTISSKLKMLLSYTFLKNSEPKIITVSCSDFTTDETDYSITITGSEDDKEINVYKIFLE